ncbi:hypothetical protein K504DRAFT_455056 [Pleomassaria siparia CBS 279.74]|uniref:Uncharacterized protein n=1 Tax=Pleomassaria siparia CBS 279.74 TaxID=1314801 RepID=A0A6G1K8T7_9PLEO|nr:hypothetical protein K504DRAFT_455056 [Pleomassaria siparia CBS 279.74]
MSASDPLLTGVWGLATRVAASTRCINLPSPFFPASVLVPERRGTGQTHGTGIFEVYVELSHGRIPANITSFKNKNIPTPSHVVVVVVVVVVAVVCYAPGNIHGQTRLTRKSMDLGPDRERAWNMSNHSTLTLRTR